jgi:hypothetical protein
MNDPMKKQQKRHAYMETPQVKVLINSSQGYGMNTTRRVDLKLLIEQQLVTGVKLADLEVYLFGSPSGYITDRDTTDTTIRQSGHGLHLYHARTFYAYFLIIR